MYPLFFFSISTVAAGVIASYDPFPNTAELSKRVTPSFDIYLYEGPNCEDNHETKEYGWLCEGYGPDVCCYHPTAYFASADYADVGKTIRSSGFAIGAYDRRTTGQTIENCFMQISQDDTCVSALWASFGGAQVHAGSETPQPEKKKRAVGLKGKPARKIFFRRGNIRWTMDAKKHAKLFFGLREREKAVYMQKYGVKKMLTS
ncbi:hypothetical protein P154DRAFT_577340 [Amniculicola lignicola CBS 123094]|uniref:Uncharacterized protein n=1 Tax=Amniculicola lignicola CBS 123094 TaxID=1392246 RepID=A0A6A5WBY2_9PLEO|nr:hypothetical protein P154DRAFT_577340 [Amniculicola lignicola CBS 123094]